MTDFIDDPILTHSFEKLYDEKSRVLILGSFPSVVSRKQSFYYANPANRFWPVMAKVFEETICDRAEFCHRHHIALWDVIASCRIHGSSDSSIHDVKVNNIQDLVDSTEIQAIFMTGRKAMELYQKYITCTAECFGLPSTSPANATVSIEQLKEAYGLIREYAEEKD